VRIHGWGAPAVDFTCNTAYNGSGALTFDRRITFNWSGIDFQLDEGVVSNGRE